MLKISVVTVCKNAESSIERAMTSVLSQTYQNYEYIIIDGASTDQTISIISQYQDRISRVISELDHGVYHAMNKGIQSSTGDFICFVNADDHLFSNTVLQDYAQVIAGNPEIDLIYGDHQACFTSGDCEIHAPVAPENILDEIICLGDRQPLQPATLFKKTAFQRIGLFNPNYKIAADYDWFLRYFSDSLSRPYYHHQPFVSYYHGGLSSQIKALYSELFAIQNSSLLCQRPDHVSRRLKRMERMFVEKYDLLERTNELSLKRLQVINFLEEELAKSNALSLKRLSVIDHLEAEINKLKRSTQPLFRSIRPALLKRVVRTAQRKFQSLKMRR